MPLIAILRGLRPEEAIDVADALKAGDFKLIEVPLNSPKPLQSIEILAKHLGDEYFIGAGTVLKTADVDAVASVGGRFIVAPNLSREVGIAARQNGLNWCPGVLTPTEAFDAIDLGADLLKIYPAEIVPPSGVAALRTVLPPEVVIAVVGGITPERMAAYVGAGADGFGLGSGLFNAGMRPREIQDRAIRYNNEFNKLRMLD